MNEETRAALNALNRRFYEERGSEFSATRERPWSGWRELFDRHGSLLKERPRVLDVGCGNGRFARFLDERIGRFHYLGVDASPLALAEAQKRLAGRDEVRLVHHDFVLSDDLLPASFANEELFDLVSLFGVVHHVPGRKQRLVLLRACAGRLGRRGLLVFTLWRFDRYERFRKKLVPWPDILLRSGIELDVRELEPGDHVMTWGAPPPALRYCHAMSAEEESEVVEELPLELVSRFDAEAEPNRYYVFRNVQ